MTLILCSIALAAGILLGVAGRRLSLKRRKRSSDAALHSPIDLLHYARRSGYFSAFPCAGEIVVLGDSRVEHADWNEVLGRAGVCNRGISGDTSAGVANRLKISLGGSVAVCVVQVGVNDLWRGVPIEEITPQFDSIIRYIADEKGAELIVTSIIHVDADRGALNREIRRLNSCLAAMCSRQHLHWIDLNGVLAPDGYLESRFTDDGTHLSGAAYAAIAGPLRHIVAQAKDK